MSILNLLTARCSVRHYDENVVISKEEIEDLLSVAIKSPSGNDSQPYRFIIITEPKLREKLLPIAFNQQQVLTLQRL